MQGSNKISVFIVRVSYAAISVLRQPVLCQNSFFVHCIVHTNYSQPDNQIFCGLQAVDWLDFILLQHFSYFLVSSHRCFISVFV